MIVFDRDRNELYRGSGPQSGTYGQISLRRLCEQLEASGETKPGERITHLEIGGGLVKYRVVSAAGSGGAHA